MTSWATVTLKIDADNCVYDERYKKEPTGITIDSGIDDQGWKEEDVYYALSYGRYQDRRFEGFLEDMHCPKFTGVSTAIVSHMNDTGDDVTSTLYKPKQRRYQTRKDGYEPMDEIYGNLYPDDDLVDFEERVFDEWGVSPVINPPESIVPPDMIVTKSKNND